MTIGCKQWMHDRFIAFRSSIGIASGYGSHKRNAECQSMGGDKLKHKFKYASINQFVPVRKIAINYFVRTNQCFKSTYRFKCAADSLRTHTHTCHYIFVIDDGRFVGHLHSIYDICVPAIRIWCVDGVLLTHSPSTKSYINGGDGARVAAPSFDTLYLLFVQTNDLWSAAVSAFKLQIDGFISNLLRVFALIT